MARTTLTFSQKHQLVAFASANPHLKHQELVSWCLSEFGKSIGRSTVSRIVSSTPPAPVRMDSRRQRRPQYPEMEEQLLEFVALHEASSSLSDFVLWEKANDLIRPHAVSFSWVQKFKRRYNIRLRHAQGEAGSVDLDALEEKRRELQDLVEGYQPEDVFNFDETGLFFRMLPSQSLALGRVRGKKKDKARITVGLCCNMAGTEKAEPVIIHSSMKPRCFRGIVVDRLGVQYFANKKAWMTRAVFLEWLHRFNLKMRGRRVLLLVDNAASHESIELSNTRVCFLPPNTTAFLQPLDAGIIKSFKCKYKTRLIRWVIEQLEGDGVVARMDVLTAIKFTVEAWSEVTGNTMRNCWCHTGIVPATVATELKNSNDCDDAGDIPELSAMIRHLDLDDPLDVHAYVEIEDVRPSEILDGDEGGFDQHDGVSDAEEDEEEDRPFSHREALLACQQLSIYAFSQGHVAAEIASLMAHARQKMLVGMKQQKISSFFLVGEDSVVEEVETVEIP